MLRMRLGNCCTNHGDSRRMYPARQTSSTWCSRSAVTTARSCSSRALPFEGMTRAVSPRRLAESMPGASGLLEMTTEMSALSLHEATLSAMASKFDPRPERSMPRFFISDAEMIPVLRQDCRCFRAGTNRVRPKIGCFSAGPAAFLDSGDLQHGNFSKLGLFKKMRGHVVRSARLFVPNDQRGCRGVMLTS